MKYGLEEQTLQTIFLIFGKYPEVEEYSMVQELKGISSLSLT